MESYYYPYALTPSTCSSLSERGYSSDEDDFSDGVALKKPINVGKYKTEMCKNYSEMGYCPYWEKCQFAHGI